MTKLNHQFCVLSYNRPVLLKKMIDSIIKQTIKNIRIKVSDCSSNDDVSKVIEKHFSNNISKKTFRDHAISLDQKSVDIFLEKLKNISNYLKIKKDLSLSERYQKNYTSFRRSIYAKSKIKTGEVFTEDNIICLRPFKKISSKNFFKLIKKKSKKKFKKGDLII